MKLGIVYDLKEDYGIDAQNIDFCDFSNLLEIQHIKQVLERSSHYVNLLGSPHEFLLHIKDIQDNNYDLILNFSEGYQSRNRESIVPSLCEAYSIPCTFSDAHAMDLTLHKHQMLLFAESLGIDIPRGFLFIPWLHNVNIIPEFIEQKKLPFPIVSKPNHEGTSMGLEISYCLDELIYNVEKSIEKYQQEIRCDEYIDGNEIAIPILGTDKNAHCLGIVEYQQLNGTPIEIFSTTLKSKGMHKTIFQHFSNSIDERIINTALFIHRSIPCYDLSRIDMRLKNGIPYLLEVTPLPGMNPGSTVEMCAASNGYSAEMLYAEIIDSAILRYKKKKRNA
jgi:D-alanine-D-alanine ligase